MEHEKTPSECFQYGQETRAQLDKLENRHDEFAMRVFEKLEDLDKALLSRLPLWATMGFAVLTMVLGALIAKVIR